MLIKMIKKSLTLFITILLVILVFSCSKNKSSLRNNSDVKNKIKQGENSLAFQSHDFFYIFKGKNKSYYLFFNYSSGDPTFSCFEQQSIQISTFEELCILMDFIHSKTHCYPIAVNAEFESIFVPNTFSSSKYYGKVLSLKDTMELSQYWGTKEEKEKFFKMFTCWNSSELNEILFNPK
jgi:hypothetical protein